MRNFALCILFTCFSFGLRSQTVSFSGVVSTDSTWNADTIKITGNVWINTGVTLSVSPGTHIEFDSYYEIIVSGKILAIGNPAGIIYFTVRDTTGFSDLSATSGKWNGINMVFGSGTATDTSIFKYCKFSYYHYKAIAVNFGYSAVIENCSFNKGCNALALTGCSGYLAIRKNHFTDNYYTAINISNCSHVQISSNTIRQNRDGIDCNSSTAEISTNVISDNVVGIGIGDPDSHIKILKNQITYNMRAISLLHTLESPVLISANIIRYNDAGMLSTYSKGAGIHLFESSPVIANNTISDNKAAGAAGISITVNSSPLIVNNKICNNYNSGTGNDYLHDGAAIFCIHSSPRIISNIIANNEAQYSGAGIAFLDSCNAVIVNNTIVNNLSVNGVGGGLCFYTAGRSILKNNIIWGNVASSENQIYYNASSPSLAAAFCNTDTLSVSFDSLYYQDVVVTDPLFVNPSAGAGNAYDGLTSSWFLQSASPCINAGTPDTSSLHLPATDVSASPRIQFGRIDIGAIESNEVVGISDLYLDNEISVYPNPFTSTFHILLPVTIKKLQLTITDIAGKLILQKSMENRNSIDPDLSSCPAGLYLIEITGSEGELFTQQIIKK